MFHCTLFSRAQREENFCFIAPLFFPESFLLHPVLPQKRFHCTPRLRTQREDNYYSIVRCFAQQFIVPLVGARSAKQVFTLLYPLLIRKLSIVPLFARTKLLLYCATFGSERFLWYPFLLRKFLLYPFWLRASLCGKLLVLRNIRDSSSRCISHWGGVNEQQHQIANLTIIIIITCFLFGLPPRFGKDEFPVRDFFVCLPRGAAKNNWIARWSGKKQCWCRNPFFPLPIKDSA